MPDKLFEDIKEQAKKNRRNITQEILVIMENSVSPKPKGKTLHKEKRGKR